MPVWSKTQIRRKAWRQPSECISYKPGEEPKVFTPKPKGKPQTRKTDETAQRLLHRIEDCRSEDRGLL